MGEPRDIGLMRESVAGIAWRSKFFKLCSLGLGLLILALVTVGFAVERPETDSGSGGWRGDALIAHAGGGIDGQEYTNSKEAFEQSYAKGMRSIELDFRLTSDEKLVCCHTWKEQLCSDYEAGHIYSEEEFLNIHIYDRYTPMSLETVLELMKKYDDVWIVTDTKSLEDGQVQKEFEILLETAEAADSMEVLNRFVVQLYTHEMYDMVEEVYSFPTYILTLYRIGGIKGETFEEHCSFLREKGIEYITMRYDWVSQEAVAVAGEYGVSVYAHTVNDIEEMEELREMGVKGIYTDEIYPERLNQQKDI
ncbi:MAG: hypothetical protein NC092_14185 [Butyrivibrio sp.]|nr:hypothetical protein [Muribaculum sp.]MCM1553818.1 hypothetical protein [Butyrivibrio sp.]